MRTNLKQIRELSGKTQEAVANELGISLSTYRSWEQGQRDLNGKKLDMLADYFHVSTDTILGTKHGQPIDELTTEARRNTMSLSPDEMQLVSLYRQMSDEDKESFIRSAQVYAFAGEAKKDTATRVSGIVD